MSLTLRVLGTRARALGGRALFTFGEAGGQIGRAAGNDWVLPDPERYVSSRHARISMVNGRFNLHDTSSNGTFVNGAREALGRSHSHLLADGDRLTMGGYEIAVEIGDRPVDDLYAMLATGGGGNDASMSVPDLGAEIDLSGLMRQPAFAADGTPADAAPAAPAAWPLHTLHAFYRAAGLDVASPDAAGAQRVLGLAGLLLRELLTGLVAESRERRGRTGSTGTGRSRADLRRDPIEDADSVDEALALLFSLEARRLVPPVESVRAAFAAVQEDRRRDAAAHERALTATLVRLDPSQLRDRFGDSADLAFWRQFQAYFERLVDPSGLPRTWPDDLAEARRADDGASGRRE